MRYSRARRRTGLYVRASPTGAATVASIRVHLPDDPARKIRPSRRPSRLAELVWRAADKEACRIREEPEQRGTFVAYGTCGPTQGALLVVHRTRSPSRVTFAAWLAPATGAASPVEKHNGRLRASDPGQDSDRNGRAGPSSRATRLTSGTCSAAADHEACTRDLYVYDSGERRSAICIEERGTVDGETGVRSDFRGTIKLVNAETHLFESLYSFVGDEGSRNSAGGVTAQRGYASAPVWLARASCSRSVADQATASLGYTSPPVWPENESVWKCRSASSAGRATSRRLRKDGIIPGVLYGRGQQAAPDLRPRARASARADGRPRPARDPRRRPRGPEDDALVDPQGLPGRSDPREDRPLRPPGGAARPADPDSVVDRARRRVASGRRPAACSPRSRARFASRRCRWRCPSGSSSTSARWRSATRSGCPTCARPRASPARRSRDRARDGDRADQGRGAGARGSRGRGGRGGVEGEAAEGEEAPEGAGEAPAEPRRRPPARPAADEG